MTPTNARQPGRLRRRLYRVVGSLAASSDSPFGAVLAIGRRETARRHWFVAIALLAAYGSVIGTALLAPRDRSAEPPPREIPVLTVVAPAELPPSPPPQVPPEERPPAQTRRAPPPAAAQTAKALTRKAEAQAPVDLSDFDLVEGHAEAYVGGVSAASGTSATAVTNLAARGAGPTARPRSSQGRPATPSRADWSCAWPEAEEQSDRREARVSIRVTVATDGRPENVEMVGSPEPGFAEAARQCALRERFTPALDAQGRRVQSQTPAFVVHFVR